MKKPDIISCNWPPQEAICPHVIEFCHCILPQRLDTRSYTFSSWVLDYEYENSTYCRMKGRPDWQPRPAQRMHLYAPGMVYSEKPNLDMLYTHAAWFLFTGPLEENLGPFVGKHGYAMFDDPEGLVGHILHNAALTVQRQGPDAYWSVHASLATCLGYLTSARHIQSQHWSIASEHRQEQDGFNLVSTVDDYLRTHLAERVTLEELSEHVGVSRSTLSHQYRKLTGETPMARLLHQRVEVAKVFVRRGYPLRHIAVHVGFCDEYHFAKTFKRITGMTPKQFRRAEPPRSEE
ncbi:MAG: helix-turn-helix transcriptional regulator [Phycisphaerae bacterium]|nr:helix-turn-helix transcriptional regulator [Phycisphaerae bacterium]